MAFAQKPPNPKRDRSSIVGRAGWYPYYAGFSGTFAEHVLTDVLDVPHASVLDPWNGSGTTTAVTAGKGYAGFGFDLNPVMVIVARARLLNKRERWSLTALSRVVIEISRRYDEQWDDPLCLWIRECGARNIRRLETGIQKVLFGWESLRDIRPKIAAGEFSDLAAFFYVALFRTVRAFLHSFSSSNPTWLKVPQNPQDRITVSWKALTDQFLTQIANMESALDVDPLDKDAPVHIAVASSDLIPLDTESVDFVLSSPPYCTRLDYASATRPELAILGSGKGESFDQLRRGLIGTPTVPKEGPTPQDSWGHSCLSFLNAVESHRSRASRSYYYKGHCQYFRDIFASLREIHRCLRRRGAACLVVQDSFYKDVHNDLPQIFTEMADNLNLRLVDRHDFKSRRTMRGLNSTANKYIKQPDTTESVMFFSKI